MTTIQYLTDTAKALGGPVIILTIIAALLIVFGLTGRANATTFSPLASIAATMDDQPVTATERFKKIKLPQVVERGRKAKK